jgi:RNase P subunit RPR2
MTTTVTAHTNGVLIQCLVCGFDEFSEKRSPVRAALHALVPSAHDRPGPVSLVCRHCGHVHQFDAVRAGGIELRVAG